MCRILMCPINRDINYYILCCSTLCLKQCSVPFCKNELCILEQCVRHCVSGVTLLLRCNADLQYCPSCVSTAAAIGAETYCAVADQRPLRGRETLCCCNSCTTSTEPTSGNCWGELAPPAGGGGACTSRGREDQEQGESSAPAEWGNFLAAEPLCF